MTSLTLRRFRHPVILISSSSDRGSDKPQRPLTSKAPYPFPPFLQRKRKLPHRKRASYKQPPSRRPHHSQNPSCPPPHSRIILPHDLGRLHSIHLLRPTRCRLEFADRANLIERVTGHANIVVALEHNLHVADVEGGVWADLCQAARRCYDVIDEIVGETEDGLGGRLLVFVVDDAKESHGLRGGWMD